MGLQPRYLASRLALRQVSPQAPQGLIPQGLSPTHSLFLKLLSTSLTIPAVQRHAPGSVGACCEGGALRLLRLPALVLIVDHQTWWR